MKKGEKWFFVHMRIGTGNAPFQWVRFRSKNDLTSYLRADPTVVIREAVSIQVTGIWETESITMVLPKESNTTKVPILYKCNYKGCKGMSVIHKESECTYKTPDTSPPKDDVDICTDLRCASFFAHQKKDCPQMVAHNDSLAVPTKAPSKLFRCNGADQCKTDCNHAVPHRPGNCSSGLIPCLKVKGFVKCEPEGNNNNEPHEAVKVAVEPTQVENSGWKEIDTTPRTCTNPNCAMPLASREKKCMRSSCHKYK